MSKNIRNFIRASYEKKPVAAMESFDDEMSARVAVVLEEKRASIMQNMFNESDEDEYDEIDLDDLTEEEINQLIEDGVLEVIDEEDEDLDEETLDELSKGTLGRYVNKAARDMAKNTNKRDLSRYAGDLASVQGKYASSKKDRELFNKIGDHHYNTAYKADNRQGNRSLGIKRAVNRLTKEETESQE